MTRGSELQTQYATRKGVKSDLAHDHDNDIIEGIQSGLGRSERETSLLS